MYTLARKLFIIRTKLKAWCLDKKNVLGINWQGMLNQLTELGTDISSLSQGHIFETHRSQIVDEACLAYSYWRQRSRDQQCQMGELPSYFLFNCVKQRQKHNHLYTLRDSQGIWLEDSSDITNLISAYFHDLFSAPFREHTNVQSHLGNITLVLRELHLPTFSLRFEFFFSSLLGRGNS